jgi:nitroreductase
MRRLTPLTSFSTRQFQAQSAQPLLQTPTPPAAKTAAQAQAHPGSAVSSLTFGFAFGDTNSFSSALPPFENNDKNLKYTIAIGGKMCYNDKNKFGGMLSMTNEVLKAIADRRSIRQYTPDQLTKEQLDTLLKAAVESPSARNSQPWHFSVVQSSEIISQVNAAAVEQLSKQGGFYSQVRDIFYSAPTVFFISADMEATPWANLDCGIAVQTLALAAHSIGLGTVILGLPNFAFEGDKADSLKALLKFPEKHTLAISLAVGVPAGTKEAHPVEPNKITVL